MTKDQRRLSGSLGSIWPPTALPSNDSVQRCGAPSTWAQVPLGLERLHHGDPLLQGGCNDTGAHTGALWTSAGQQLATVTFTNESAIGWQQANLITPVAIAANTVYVVSYLSPHGPSSPLTSATSREGAIDNPPLHALRDGDSGANGVFLYSSTQAFPNADPRRVELLGRCGVHALGGGHVAADGAVRRRRPTVRPPWRRQAR